METFMAIDYIPRLRGKLILLLCILVLILSGCARNDISFPVDSFTFVSPGRTDPLLLHNSFKVDYSFDIQVIDPSEPAYLHFSATPYPDDELVFEQDEEEFLGDYVYSHQDLDLSAAVHITGRTKLTSRFSSKIGTQYTVEQDGLKEYAATLRVRSHEENYFFFLGNNVSVTNLQFKAVDGYKWFGLGAGELLRYAGKLLLYIIIVMAVEFLLGAGLMTISPSGIYAAYTSWPLVWLLFAVINEVPFLYDSKMLRPVLDFVIRVGEFFRFTLAFRRSQGIFTVLVAWVFIALLFIAAIFMFTKLVKEKRWWLALPIAVVVQVVLYSPLSNMAYEVLGTVIGIALGVLICAPLIRYILGVIPALILQNGDPNAPDPGEETGESYTGTSIGSYVYGENDVNPRPVERDSNGTYWIYDENGHRRTAREFQPGRLVDDDGKTYRS